MAIAPIDYSSGANQSFLTGLQGANSIQNIQQNRQLMQQRQLQQQRLQAFQQAWSPAYQSGDPNQIQAVAAQFPEQIKTMQDAIGFRDDQHRNSLGNLARDVKAAYLMGGPEAAAKVAQQNPALLQSLQSSPEEFSKLMQTDPTAAITATDHLGMLAMQPKDYYDAVQKQRELTETGRHNQATEGLTARGQDVTARGQDLTYNAAIRGQNVTARGQDLNFQSQGLDRDLKQQQFNMQQGKAYQQKIADYGKDMSNLQAMNDQYDRGIDLTKRLLSGNTAGITGARGVFPDAPGSNASNTEALRENLKTQVGMVITQALRDASKTGSTGFGNMTNQELNNLQNSIASLDRHQSESQFRANAGRILEFLQKSKQRVNNYASFNYPKSFVDSIPKDYQPQQQTQSAGKYSNLWGG